MKENTIFLIDGHALIFRMYYAFLKRPMINSKGRDTSILYGFTKYVLDLIAREQPSHVAVSFDPPGGSFRNEMYPLYKANRDATPQLVIDALEPLTELCKALHITVVTIRGYEADDVIGSLAKRAEREGLKVFMVTPDKDYGQLISEQIIQYRPGKAGEEHEEIGIAQVCAKYGIDRPSQVIDMLAICGDASDNVPGVKGVGEVGAGKLIAKYGSLEEIYSHLDELSASQKQKFLDARDHIALSKELVTIKTDMDIDIPTSAMVRDGKVDARASELFDLYEFGSLKRHLKGLTTVGESVAADPAPRKEVKFVSCPVDKVHAAALESGRCAVAFGDGGIICAAAKADTGGSESTPVIVCKGTETELAELLGDPSIAKYGHGFKPIVKRYRGIRGRLMDIEIMDYLVNPEKSHKLDLLCRSELGVELEEATAGQGAVSGGVQETLFDAFFGNDDGNDADGNGCGNGDDGGDADGNSCGGTDSGTERIPAREAALIYALGILKEDELARLGLTSLYEEMEAPLIRVLASMEETGVKVDLASLASFAEELRREVANREACIRELVGEPTLNISSPKQVGELLFGKLALDPKAKKSKTGSYSTDEETLEAISDRHPAVNEILEYRAAKKLLSTYIEPFPDLVDRRSGKIHTTFNQSLTATGRLSSSKPNLQNIPIRTDRGREIRKAFVPSRPDGFIMSADYSQIELRIMAHLCRDEHLVEAFRNGTDIHKATAAKTFGIPADEVSADQRRIAKTANFGIMYGISAFGLSQRLKISRNEARKIIDDYFASFPSIRKFIDSTLESARANGYVETLFGRRRYVPDITSQNGTVRALAERNAVNAPIQGTSADIIKLAMVAVDRRIREAGLASRMVLQIHDELVFDVAPGETDTMMEIVTREMENVIALSIPLTVECNYGKNWLEAH